MTALPRGWSVRTVKDLLPIRYGKSLAANLRVADGKYPVVGSAGEMARTDESLINGPTIIVGRKGNVGAVQLLTEGGWPIDTTYYSEVPVELDPRFVTHQLIALRLVRLDSSTATPSLRRQDYEVQELVVPPLDEQRRIVDILEDHLSRLDAAEGELNNALRRAATLRNAVVRAELARFEGPLRTIHQLSDSVRNGIFVSRAKAEPNGVPILRIGAVRPLSLDLGDLRYSERDELDLQRADSLLAPGDLLFTRYNGNPRFVGACAVVPENAGSLTYPDKLIRVRITAREAVPEYVALACTVGPGREQIHSHVKTTSGQAGISGRDLKAVTLVVPSIEQQQLVVVAAHERLDAVVDLSKMLSVSARRCSSLRRSLLAAAFSGRLSGHSSDMEMLEEMAGV